MHPQTTNNDHKSAEPMPTLHRGKSRLSSSLAILLAVFLLLVVLTGMSVYAIEQNRVDKLQTQIQALKAQQSQSASKLTDSIQGNKFQAVFVNVPGSTGGQVYFGHLSLVDSENYKLADIYYLSDNGTLVKLGSEPHKPQDAMYLPKTSVIFWENLKDASQFEGQLK